MWEKSKAEPHVLLLVWLSLCTVSVAGKNEKELTVNKVAEWGLGRDHFFLFVLKELRHCSCILKKLVKLLKIVISNPFKSSPSLFLFALESPLWYFSSSANHFLGFHKFRPSKKWLKTSWCSSFNPNGEPAHRLGLIVHMGHAWYRLLQRKENRRTFFFSNREDHDKYQLTTFLTRNFKHFNCSETTSFPGCLFPRPVPKSKRRDTMWEQGWLF